MILSFFSFYLRNDDPNEKLLSPPACHYYYYYYCCERADPTRESRYIVMLRILLWHSAFSKIIIVTERKREREKKKVSGKMKWNGVLQSILHKKTSTREGIKWWEYGIELRYDLVLWPFHENGHLTNYNYLFLRLRQFTQSLVKSLCKIYTSCKIILQNFPK